MRSQNRRGFLGLLAGVLAAPRLASPGTNDTSDYFANPDNLAAFLREEERQRASYGYLTPEIVTARGYDNGSARVFLNDVDITKMRELFGPILAADDRVGFIEVFQRNEHGRWFSGIDGKLVRARIYGDVRVTMSKVHGA